MNENIKNVLVAAVLVGMGVASRIILHEPNFAAIAAVGLFAGFYFRGWKAYLVPLAAVLLSDIFVGFYNTGVMAVVYLAWLVPVLVGKSNIHLGGINNALDKILAIAGKSVLASIGFYIVSNLGVWLFSGMYTKTLAGLIECYALAIPFLRPTLLGDLFFSGVIFGSYYLIQNLASNKKQLVPAFLRK